MTARPARRIRTSEPSKRNSRGITFGQLIREALAEKVAGEESAESDPLFRPVPLPEGVKLPRDLVENLDDYLYGPEGSS